MKQALFYQKKSGNNVQCDLCPRNCTISPDKTGVCNVRKNIDGKLYSLVYEKPCSVSIDPIEKKPLYHFLPGSKALSIGTIGCNFFCKGCQNFDIARAKSEEHQFKTVSCQEVVQIARQKNCPIIAYTYNEPTVFYEYMLDTVKLAKEQGIKNIAVSNGYINEAPLRELCKVLDGVNIDLKSFSTAFYKEYTKGSIEPVKRTIKILKEEGIYFEITNLLIPGLNDDLVEFENMCKWIATLSKDTVLHISRFFPFYRAKDIAPTPEKTIDQAARIARKHLNYVYVGNMGREQHTLCPACAKIVVERGLLGVKVIMENGKCSCGKEIPGIWN
ncbi:MAG: AmmeMemoRadiSam system radical SAM enzyme [Nanoarchaeota archaeon]|nr:AmmeMemoRadiSam system radical SAM enzyme [Nanoarchaeota archaeon]